MNQKENSPMGPKNDRNRTKRLIGLSMVLSGAVIFVIAGFVLARDSVNGSCDFGPVYYHSRALVQQEDPYIEVQARYLKLAPGGYLNPNAVTRPDQIDLPCVYPPTALFVAAPLALLPWRPADFIWMTLSAVSLVSGSILVWTLAADFAPLLAGGLIGFYLANSVTVLFEANAAGPVVGLCAVAVALFLKRRLHILAIICLAVSLCLKPHDGGLVWLLLLLSGGVLRRRALQTLVVAALIALPAFLWVSHVSPHWRQQMSSNIARLSSQGGVNDPGPTTTTAHVTNSAVNLQTIVSVFVNRPSFYNTVSLIFSTLLLLCLAWAALRARGTIADIYIGLAAASALSMLPVYHRHHDARLLLLAIPACAALWAQRRVIGQVGILIAFAAIALTGDLPRAILDNLEEGHRFTTTSLSEKLQMILFNRPAALALLIMSIFFVWLYMRSRWQTDHHLADADKSEIAVAQIG